MLLRPIQQEFVNNAISCLRQHNKTLGIAPTGFGKSVAISAVLREVLKDNLKACVLAHRDELTYQNEDKFKKVNPEITTSFCNGDMKDWSGQVTFAMVQTISRSNNIDYIPRLDVLVIDEAHHSPSPSYLRVIDKLKEKNPDLKLFGVTATPIRNDSGMLKEVFGNVCHVIKLRQLIDLGYLVPPRTFVIDLGIQKEIEESKNKDGEYDMEKVNNLMNMEVINEKIIEEWQKTAGDRKTVVFCSTIAHAQAITLTFIASGIKAALITGEMSKDERRLIFEAMDNGKIQVIVNVAVLTEGWDYPPISCVVLLRPCSFKGTMIQMIGRGLRTIDPAIYPNLTKDDCIVLDFGTSLITHGSLEQDIHLAKKQYKNSKKEENECPNCFYVNKKEATKCAFCGIDLQKKDDTFDIADTEEKEKLSEFELAEINLLGKSNFEWININKILKVSATFYSTALIKKYDKNRYIALGFLEENKEVHILANTSNYNQALAAASDYMNNHNTDDSCSKSKQWLRLEPTQKQREYLSTKYIKKELNRYEAMCVLRIKFNLPAIRSVAWTANVNFGL